MHVAVNHQRRAFMAAVDGVSEFAFHAAMHPGEEPAHWTASDARRVFGEAVGGEVPIEVLSTGVWTAGHSLVAQRFGQGRVFIAGDAAVAGRHTSYAKQFADSVGLFEARHCSKQRARTAMQNVRLPPPTWMPTLNASSTFGV